MEITMKMKLLLISLMIVSTFSACSNESKEAVQNIRQKVGDAIAGDVTATPTALPESIQTNESIATPEPTPTAKPEDTATPTPTPEPDKCAPGKCSNNPVNEQLSVTFDEDGFYCIGDAVRFENPLDPSKGIIFDGRVSENFKLSTGTWVSVGNLRTAVVTSANNVIQDAVITGHDQDEIGILVFPNIIGCRALSPGLSPEATVESLVANKNVRDALMDGLRAYNETSSGSSTRIARALFMIEPPDIDANEITDKGYINQRAVLERRQDLVAELYSSDSKNLLIL